MPSSRLKPRSDSKKAKSTSVVSTRMPMEIHRFSLPTLTATASCTESATVQGRARPTSRSKVLEPTAFATAMPPRPSRATSTDDIRSGADVPAASKVKATITGGMPIPYEKTIVASTKT